VLSGQLKFDAARTAYINALRDYPGSLRARFNLARLANMQGRTGEVEQYLGDILRQEPANEQALTMLAAALAGDGRIARAISLAEAGRTAAPANPSVAALLADLYVRNNEARRALEVTDAAMKDLQTPPPNLILARARAQVTLGLLKEAQEGFRLLLAADPSDITARRALVEIMLRDNSPDSARALLRDGLAAQPGHPALIQTLIGIDLREGQPARALTTLAELQKDPRNLPASRGLRGDIYMSGNNFIAAAQASVEDVNETPRADLVLRAANALGAANRPTEASRLLTEWVAKAPDDMNARLALISYDIAARRHSEAEAQLEQLLEKQPLNPVALNNLAWLYHLKNDPRARTLAQRAWLLAPSAQVADTLGWILTSQGEAVAALPLLRQAARELPGEPTIQYHLAVALSEAGIRDEAITILRPLAAGTVTFDEKDDATRLLERLSRR
jgi:putative PEP-CTERM system TPR-repeat lipoprotein